MLKEKKIREIVGAYPQADYFICGPNTFNKDIEKYLRNAGVEQSSIFTESFNYANNEDMKIFAPYRLVGIVMLLLFFIQDFFHLKSMAYEALLQKEQYRIYSGLFLLFWFSLLFVRPYGKAKTYSCISAKTYSWHTWVGALSPLAFFIHSTTFGVGYLGFLSALFFANIIVGITNHELLPNASKRFFYYHKIWLPLHIILAMVTLAMVAIHIYVVGAY